MKKQKIKCSTHVPTREAAVEMSEKIIRSFTSTPELGIAMTHCSSMYVQSRRHFGVVCSLSPNAEITLLGKAAIPRVQFVPCTWDSLRDQGANAETIASFKENDWETMFPLIVACPYGYEGDTGINFSIAWTVRFADAADVLLAVADAARKDRGRQATQTRPPDAQKDEQEEHDKRHANEMKRLEEKLFNQGAADLFDYYKDHQSEEKGKYFQPGACGDGKKAADEVRKSCSCKDPHCSFKRKSPSKKKPKADQPPKPQSPKKKTFAVTFVPKSHEIYGGRKCDMFTCDERARGQCPRCKLTTYCGTKCQTLHWASGHKLTCGKPLEQEPLFSGKGAMAAAIALSEIAMNDGTGPPPSFTAHGQEKPKIKRSEPILFYFCDNGAVFCRRCCHEFAHLRVKRQHQ